MCLSSAPCAHLKPDLDPKEFQHGQLLVLVWGLGFIVAGHALALLISLR
jgi:hypothetical protein